MHSVDEILHEFEKELSNLKILRTGEVFEFAGTRFLGDTMWASVVTLKPATCGRGKTGHSGAVQTR